MKLILGVLAATLLCAACAGGPPPSGSSQDGITMYGTIDEGVSFHSK
ncbi:hypothetical protein [Paraburkholderia phosphatilytica]|nr:hypothetical protein [Paraburkholderia phosphatilytica]